MVSRSSSFHSLVVSKMEMVLYNVIYRLPSVRLDSNMVCTHCRLNKNECGRNQLELSCEQLSFLFFTCFGVMNGKFYVSYERIHIEFYSF